MERGRIICISFYRQYALPNPVVFLGKNCLYVSTVKNAAIQQFLFLCADPPPVFTLLFVFAAIYFI